jgi:hypothetical protein
VSIFRALSSCRVDGSKDRARDDYGDKEKGARIAAKRNEDAAEQRRRHEKMRKLLLFLLLFIKTGAMISEESLILS